MKTKIGLLLAVVMLASITTTAPAIAVRSESPQVLSEQVLIESIQPLLDAYEEYYCINDATISSQRHETYNDIDYVTFLLTLNMTLRFEEIGQHPLVQGIVRGLNLDTQANAGVLDSVALITQALKRSPDFTEILSRATSSSSSARLRSEVIEEVASQTANRLMTSIEEFKTYLGKSSDFNHIIRIGVSPDGEPVSAEIEQFDCFVPLEAAFPANPDILSEEGAAIVPLFTNMALNKITDATTGALSVARANPDFTYKRVDASTYMNTYTSSYNATVECGHIDGDGDPIEISRNMNEWNSNYSKYCHADCANYVSQAMAVGGVKPDEKWKPDALPWVNVNNMYDYFKTEMNYWVASTNAACNAGGIIYNLSGTTRLHTYMCVSNDGVTKTLSAHTTDRKQEGYTTSGTGIFGSYTQEYYVFENVDPLH